MPSHTLSDAAAELHRRGVTVSCIASALQCSVQHVSMQLRGARRLDPALLAVVRALTDDDTVSRVISAIPAGGVE